MLQNEKEAPAIFATVDMDVAKVYPTFACFTAYSRTKALGEHSFAGADIPCYYNSLSHSFGVLQDEAEEFHQ